MLTSPLQTQNDTLVFGYVQGCRRLVETEGVRPHPEVIYGPANPNVRRLIETHWDLVSAIQHASLAPPPPPPHPLVELATGIFDNDNLLLPLERVGTYLLLQQLLAWLIKPTQETYSRIGGDLAPRPSQQIIPHELWVDVLFWGQLRDVVIQRPEVYATAEFRHMYYSSLRLLNWPIDTSEAFVSDHSNGAIYLTNPFIRHALQTGNWALEEGFFRRYPELRELVPMQRHGL